MRFIPHWIGRSVRTAPACVHWLAGWPVAMATGFGPSEAGPLPLGITAGVSLSLALAVALTLKYDESAEGNVSAQLIGFLLPWTRHRIRLRIFRGIVSCVYFSLRKELVLVGHGKAPNASRPSFSSQLRPAAWLLGVCVPGLCLPRVRAVDIQDRGLPGRPAAPHGHHAV
jgi:hypothetical protein